MQGKKDPDALVSHAVLGVPVGEGIEKPTGTSCVMPSLDGETAGHG